MTHSPQSEEFCNLHNASYYDQQVLRYMHPQQPCKSRCVKCTELKGNQTKEAPQTQTIRSGTQKYTHSSFSLDSPSVQNPCLKVAKNMTMTAVPSCLHHCITISDIMNKASMFGKRIKCVTSQPFPILHGYTENQHGCTLTGSNLKQTSISLASLSLSPPLSLYIYCQNNQSMNVEIFPHFLLFQANLHLDFVSPLMNPHFSLVIIYSSPEGRQIHSHIKHGDRCEEWDEINLTDPRGLGAGSLPVCTVLETLSQVYIYIIQLTGTLCIIWLRGIHCPSIPKPDWSCLTMCDADSQRAAQPDSLPCSTQRCGQDYSLDSTSLW